MITFLLLWAIVATFIIFYLIFEPKFELRLTEEETHNLYTLYFIYIMKTDDEWGVDYKVIKLFSFKCKK